MNQRKLSGQIFDLTRLQRKQKRINYQRQKHQRMMSALEQCNSSYINSSSENKQKFPLNHQPKQKILKKENLNRLKLIQNEIHTNIDDLICEVINQININKAKDKIQQEDNYKKALIEQNRLTESNQNFIIELFNKLNLLEKYNQSDRSFLRLVKEAQTQFYLKQSFNQKLSTKQSSEMPNIHNSPDTHYNKKSFILNQDESIPSDLQQTNIRFRETLNGFSNIISEDQQNVCGYSELQQSGNTESSHFVHQFEGNFKQYYTKRYLGQQVEAYHQVADILTNFRIR